MSSYFAEKKINNFDNDKFNFIIKNREDRHDHSLTIIPTILKLLLIDAI